MTQNTLSNFVNQVVARIKGDEAEVIALKNEKKARTAIRSQISALEAKLVDDEDAVETAKENLSNAIYPSTLITDNQVYVNNIRNAQKRVDDAIEKVEDTRASLKFWNDTLNQF